MTREKIERYMASLSIVKSMLLKGLITDVDYKQASNHLAKKHCIKNGNIYLENDLTNFPKRVIYIDSKKGG